MNLNYNSGTVSYYYVSHKAGHRILVHNFDNVDRFSKFFHRNTQHYVTN